MTTNSGKYNSTRRIIKFYFEKNYKINKTFVLKKIRRIDKQDFFHLDAQQ